uniref:Casein kinase I n=1 Tax=Spongospora subterranea TaxID=70186 RepID=A0A0H5QIF4_9EUKA|eukprot:CRZ01417.1 hypothetical protein [Spongospora subterranea]
MVDMGLCKKYRDVKSKRHIPYRSNKKLTGTPRYASINTHNGSEQGRRDDLESLGYMLMYFSRGTLPWQGLKAATKQEKYDKIGKKKLETPIDELCKDSPHEFATYLKYCSKLAFSEKPDYFFLKSLFDSLFRKQGYEYDWIYDWDDLAAHELYVQRLTSAKLRQSPSEIGLAQVREELEQVKVDRDQYKAKCADQERVIAGLTEQINRPLVAAKFVKAPSTCTTDSPIISRPLRKRGRRVLPKDENLSDE